MSRILVVEDEDAIADAIGYALRAEGFEVESVGDGEHAIGAAKERSFDLLVLDLMLPSLSGLEVCRRLREQSAIPILMLTAKDAELDRVLGLESGADDYVTKPFSMPEFVASSTREGPGLRGCWRSAACTSTSHATRCGSTAAPST